MSGMNVNGNKKTSAAAKAQKAKQTKKVVKKKQPSIAEALHKLADKNIAAVGKKEFSYYLKMINEGNVMDVIGAYDNYYNTGKESDPESILETIIDETLSSHSAKKEALQWIFTQLFEKAKDAGVSSDAIKKYKAEFTKELNKSVYISHKKFDEIMYVVIQAIDNQKILTPTEKKVAVAAVNTKQIDTINIIVNRYNKALKDFNAQMKRDGWAGDVADGLSRIWGSNNTATKVRKDLKIAKKQIDELKAARNKGKAAFEAKFKKIFGVPYNAQNIMAYEKQESTYKEASIRYGIEKQFKSRCSLLLKGQPLKEETTSDMSGMVARRPSGTRIKATKEQVYKREFNNLAKAMGKDGTKTLNQLLEASNAKTLEEKYQILQNIAKDIFTNLHKAAEKARGGRSLADVEKTYQNSYKAAFGLHNDILKRVTDYNISQEKGAGIVKGATVAAAAIAAGILTGGAGAAGILTISGAAAGATAVTEISDRMTSGKAIDAAKKGGLKEYAKTVYNDVQWTDVAVQSLVSGAMAAVFAGQSIAVGRFATYTASKLGLSPVGSALMATGATTLSGIAFPIGTEYAFTGKITVEGAAFAVVLAVVAGTIQVVKISKMASAAKASAQSEAEAGIEFARKTLGIPDDVELTPEVVKQYRNAKAKALHSDRTVINGASNDLEMALVNDAYKTLTNVLKTGTVTTNEATPKPAQPSTVPTAQGTDEMGLVQMNNSIAPTAPQTAGGILPNIPHEVSDYNIADVIQKYENPDVSGHSTTSELSNGEGTRTDYLVGDGKIGLTTFENNNGMIIGAVEFMYDDGNLIRTIEYPGLNTTGKALREIAGVNAEAQKAQKTKAQASAEPKPLPTVDNPHNIVSIQAPDAVGAKAQQALAGSKYKIATAGYSAPPEGYEDATIYFLRALDINLGTEQTGYITSPTADKGSIDAITTEVAGFEKGRLFYTTAQDYVEYINPENFPTTIDTHAYAQVPKYVLPDATSYSEATAKCSNTFLATGGRNATVSDFVNAVKNGNKAVILENTSLDVPAWGEAKGRVEDASKYLVEQIQAVKDGKPLPYPEVGEFTRNFIEENMSTINDMVRSYKVDGQPESINTAAKQAAEFIKGNSHNPSAESSEYQALLNEINNCYDLDYLRHNILPKIKNLTGQKRIDIGIKYNKKFIELRDDLPQAAKDIHDSFLERVSNQNTQNSNSERMPLNCDVEVESDAILLLGRFEELDLADPKVKSILDKLSPGESITVGKKGTIKLDQYKDVSRIHLIITKQNNGYTVRDISLNGTKIDGRSFPAPSSNNTPKESNSIGAKIRNVFKPKPKLVENGKLEPNKPALVKENAKIYTPNGQIDLNGKIFKDILNRLEIGQSVTIGSNGLSIHNINYLDYDTEYLATIKITKTNDEIYEVVSESGRHVVTNENDYTPQVDIPKDIPIRLGLGDVIKIDGYRFNLSQLKDMENGQIVTINSSRVNGMPKEYSFDIIKNDDEFIIINNSKYSLTYIGTEDYCPSAINHKYQLQELKLNPDWANVPQVQPEAQQTPLKAQKNPAKHNNPVNEPTPKAVIVNTPTDAIQQSQSFNDTHKIGVNEVVIDGYKDGGRRLKFDTNGNPINQPTREIIVVDRTKDTELQLIISNVKRKTARMTDKEKAAFLQEYVFKISGGKDVEDRNFESWTNRNIGNEILLGDIITSKPAIAVCRHRSLLFKILGDEIGLKVELQRGNFVDARGSGGHAWNVVRFNDGTSAIYDAMHNQTSNITPGHFDKYAHQYVDVNDKKLYNETIPKNDIPQNFESKPAVEVKIIEGVVIEGSSIKGDFPKNVEVKCESDTILLLGAEGQEYALDLNSLNLQEGRTYTVGRMGEIEVPANYTSVSEHHLEITRQGDNFIIVDKSEYGTRILQDPFDEPDVIDNIDSEEEEPDVVYYEQEDFPDEPDYDEPDYDEPDDFPDDF